MVIFSTSLNNHVRWIVPENRPYRTPADLRGKRVATPPKNSDAYRSTQLAAAVHDIALENDYVHQGAVLASLALFDRGDVDAIVTIEPGVGRTFVSRRTGRKETVFRDFPLSIADGELVAVVGASGAGKTRPASRQHPAAPRRRPGAARLGHRPHRPRGAGGGGGPAPGLGVVFQQPRLLDRVSVRRNITLALESAGLDTGAATTAEGMLDAVGLTEYAEQYPSVLSGGQRQRSRSPGRSPSNRTWCSSTSRSAPWTRSPRAGCGCCCSGCGCAGRVPACSSPTTRWRRRSWSTGPSSFPDGHATVAHEYVIDLPRPRSPENPELFGVHGRIVASLC